MTTQTNLYIEKILKEHPTAVWSLDEDFLTTGPFAYLDSFYTVVSSVIPVQSTSNGGGYMTFNTSTAHGLQPGDYVEISGVTPIAYNGRYPVYGVSSTTSFTVNGSTTGNITIAGTAKKVYNAHEINAYNTDRYPGYVLFNTPGSGVLNVNTRALVSTVPLAYGSSDAKYGSFILPSFGMFSDAGRYKQFTLETWVKIKRSNNTNKYKLIGIFNEDPTYDDGNGLYYNDTSLVLKIGDKSDSVFVKQVNKPMLIHITYSENAANLLINGEQVINLTLEESDILQLATPTNSKYYLSFQSATFDCPAIYPYRLSIDQAKTHYAYGQAVSVPETVNKQYGSKTISIDFPSAKYANMMNYPTNAEWKHGASDNVDITKYALSNKEYSLPSFNFYDTVTEEVKTLDDFFSAYSGVWNFKSCLPNANSNIEFSTLDIFDSKLKGFYTEFSFSGTTTSTTEKTVFKIIDKFTKNYLRITIQYNGSDTEIKYRFKYNSANETTLHTQTAADYYQSSSNKTFLLVGLHIEKFSNTFGNDVANFFNNLNNLTMFVFGDNDTTLGDTTPNVDILSIKLLTQTTLDSRSLLINANGTFFHSVNTVTPGSSQYVANSSVGSYQLSIGSKSIFNTSYTYSSSNASENYFTTGSYGYWKDSVPLLHFAKNVTKNGVSSYTFDFIQFNIDYDAPVYNTSAISGVKYFDTTNSNTKTYITFEPISETYKPDSYFTTTKLPRLDRVVEPDASWATTKYEVVDGMVVYLPASQDISTLKVVVHVEITVSDSVNNSVQIKSLELASQALNDATTNPIGTKYANEIIPYKYNTSTSTYDYDGYNPFIIEKKTSPYLNLERLSGIRLVGFNRVDANTIRGLRIPLNDKQMKYSKLNSVQMFVYYDATIDPAQSNAEAYQFSTNTEIFNIVASDKTLSAYLTGASTTSKTLQISSTSGGLNENIKFYINGDLTATPEIKTNSWTLLTVVFSKPLSFDNFIGELNITGPMAFDNISFYGFRNENYINNQIDRTWSDVLNPDTGSSQYLWNAWSNDYWLDLLTMLNPDQQAIDASTLYKIYTGTNILYPGTYDRDQKLQISDRSFTLYSDYTTYKYTYPAV